MSVDSLTLAEAGALFGYGGERVSDLPPHGTIARVRDLARCENAARRSSLLRRFAWRDAWTAEELSRSLGWPGGVAGVLGELHAAVRDRDLVVTGDRWHRPGVVLEQPNVPASVPPVELATVLPAAADALPEPEPIQESPMNMQLVATTTQEPSSTQRVWDFLRTQSFPVRSSEIQAALGMKEGTVSGALHKLRHRGVVAITKDGDGRSVYSAAEATTATPTTPQNTPSVAVDVSGGRASAAAGGLSAAEVREYHQLRDVLARHGKFGEGMVTAALRLVTEADLWDRVSACALLGLGASTDADAVVAIERVVRAEADRKVQPDVEGLQAKLKEREEEIARLTERGQAATRERNDARTRLEEVQVAVERLRDELARARQDAREANADARAKSQHVDALLPKAKERAAEIAGLMDRVNVLARERDDSRAAHEIAVEQRAKLTAEVQRLDTENGRLNDILDALCSEMRDISNLLGLPGGTRHDIERAIVGLQAEAGARSVHRAADDNDLRRVAELTAQALQHALRATRVAA